jgi:hypothetical protein
VQFSQATTDSLRRRVDCGQSWQLVLTGLNPPTFYIRDIADSSTYAHCATLTRPAEIPIKEGVKKPAALVGSRFHPFWMATQIVSYLDRSVGLIDGTRIQ